MRIVVMGPGGVGGYFGARLAAAGNDVTFIARGSHLEAMRTKGLRLDAELGALTLQPVSVAADAREVDRADVVMFAVKMRDTETAAESLKGLVAKGAAIFTFQNGVESSERIARVVGAGHVVPGVARIASHISEPGVIKQIGRFASLQFGEAYGKPSDRVARFHAACTAAGIAASISESIRRELWLKFAMLAPLAAMTALTRTSIGPIRDAAETKALLEAAVDETVAVGVALETGLVAEDAASVKKVLDGLPRPMMASMAHDLMSGKPIELDGLSGAVVRLGRSAGVPTPTHRFVTQALAPFVNGAPRA
ncbi:MAG: 2-dehydropantoate 2-reductase [Hyphomicrobiaceae bacterium]|nr:2-dehydropantoate 2-reductase [Hyphomicrobiaceae bacterium]